MERVNSIKVIVELDTNKQTIHHEFTDFQSAVDDMLVLNKEYLGGQYFGLIEQGVEHLEFIYARLLNVHNEDDDYDYMIRLREIINTLKLQS